MTGRMMLMTLQLLSQRCPPPWAPLSPGQMPPQTTQWQHLSSRLAALRQSVSEGDWLIGDMV